MSNTDELIKIAHEAIDCLDNLNRQYPNLASETSKEAVVKWRRRTVSFDLNYQEEVSDEDSFESKLRTIALDLLEQNEVEDVLEIMASRHDTMMDAWQLVNLVGEKAYIGALKREVEVFASNAISYEQTATLWNSLGRPALGDESWTGRGVSMLSERNVDG